MTDQTKLDVIEELGKRGIVAHLEYTGVISVPISAGISLSCEDLNETIDIRVMQDNEPTDEVIESSLVSDSADVPAIATHIACTYCEAVEASRG